MNFLAYAISLFFVLNSFGNTPLFVALLSKYEVKRQRKIILRELFIALLILLAFNYFGDWILHTLGISESIIGIAGGTLLFIIAIGMIFPRNGEKKHELRRQEPFIFPLAMPLIAGPGAITAVLVYSQQIGNDWLLAAIILAAWIPTAGILLLSSNIKYLIGQKGLLACQKLGGMLICLVSVHMFTSGAISLIKESFPGVNH